MHALVRFAHIPAANTFSTAEIYPHVLARLGCTNEQYRLSALRYDLSKLRARIEVLPKGDPNDTATLRRFAAAILAIAPDVTGTPVWLIEAEHTVVRAFIEAGALAVVVIAVMLWIALRHFGDVLLTLVPLLVAGAVTLELMVLLGEPLNFANVIALPLLLGVGVAFKIYYIMAWRAGRTNLLQSTLTPRS